MFIIKANKLMERLFKHPCINITVIIVITMFFSAFLPQVEMDNNNFRFVPKDDPALNTSKWIEETFGSSFFILVGLKREYGTVFDSVFLNRIQDYAQKVQNIPIVKEVVSLVSADYITSIDGAITVEKLVKDDFSGLPEEINELKSRLLSWDLYERAMVSDDFKATQILIPMTISQEEASQPEINDKFLWIRDLAHEEFDSLCSVYVTGMPVISAAINEEMNSDLKLLVPLVVVVLLTVLYFSFRKFNFVILPMLTVIIAVIWSVGAMPIFGIKLSVISTVLPVILMAVGSAYGIHVVTHYITDKGYSELSRDEHRKLVLDVLRKILKPVFLAALTTFSAFFSLIFTPVLPIKEFGCFACFGVIAAFAAAVMLIPSIIIIKGPEKKKENKREKLQNTFIADNLINIVTKKKTILFIAVCILCFSVYGLTQIINDNVMIEYFKSDTEVFKSDKFIRENFGGSKVVNVVLQGDSHEIILHPDTLTAMDGLAEYLKKTPNVGKIMGFTDMIKRINQIFNINADPAGLKRTESTPVYDDWGFGFDFDSWESESYGDYSEEITVQPEQEEKFLTQREFLTLLDRAASVSRELSANDLVKELKRRINYDGASYYEIPSNPARYGKDTPEDLQRLISNYLFLLSSGISSYANDPLEPTAIKSTIQLRTIGIHDTKEAVNEINNYLAANLPSGISVITGGVAMVEESINNLIVQSQLISVFFSIFFLFFIISISYKSASAGFICIAPLSISILINFAVMGFTGIKLNLGTAMVASVSLGIGVDYSIHFMEAFKREYHKFKDSGNFLWHSFNSSGKAIIINAVGVGAGFAVLIFSRFNILIDLGFLILITMFTSALVSLTVLPVLLTLINPKFITKEKI
jgi:predicted RND superfamily exporter protein